MVAGGDGEVEGEVEGGAGGEGGRGSAVRVRRLSIFDF